MRRMDPRLAAVLARVPLLSGREGLSAERLGGLTNENYLVRADAERFVLRLAGGNSERLGIDRRAEAAALRAAWAAGLGPEPLAFLEPEGHLLTRFVEGRFLEAEEYRRPETIRLLAETARRVHALPPNGARFSPFRRIERFLAAAREAGVEPPEELGPAIRAQALVEREELGDPSDWHGLCHNDLSSVNWLYVKAEGGIRVLDWEFAGTGDVYYDLASLVYAHDSEGPIPPELEEELLAAYFGEATPGRRRRLLGMKLALNLFTVSWALAQEGALARGLISAPKGFEYLGFARWLLAHEVRLLRAAVAEET